MASKANRACGMAKGKKGSKNAAGGAGAGGNGFSTIEVDPRRVRFAHSRIKPLFSGCGRTIDQTLAEIRAGKTVPSDLPMITVILGPIDTTDGQQWFYSLNNRRLYVFKVCADIYVSTVQHCSSRTMGRHLS